MKIARIRHLFYPDMPKDYFYDLSAWQVKKGHSVDVLTWCKNGIPSKVQVGEGFAVYRLRGSNLNFGGLVQDYPYLPELPMMLENIAPDIIHGESHLFLPTLQALKKAKKLGLPCVVTVHGVFAKRGIAINSLQNAYLHTIGNHIFQESDSIICLTQNDANEISRIGCPSHKITIIPNAVDNVLFKPGSNSEENLIVWTGRFVQEKGIEYLIETARTVVKKNKNAKFLLIGYGPLKEKMIALARERQLLGTNMQFIGPIPRKDIADLLGKATIFLFPSIREGLPVSVLEAMACGLPVVGFDVPGTSEVISNNENGLLVPVKDSVSMANAVLWLLKNKDLRQALGNNARKLVNEKYSWSKVSSELDAAYKKVVMQKCD